MAQEGDIIEVMFKGMLNVLGWVFNKLFQLAVWLIKLLFKLIKLLIGLIVALIAKAFKKKNDTPQETDKN
ncbi:MAG: hypothetical protein LBN95_05140 [Prevotellaceae bacterium]|jgi:hypothetical protein|nr:hypothetical protein [Prevotellaceae bacterium]